MEYTRLNFEEYQKESKKTAQYPVLKMTDTKTPYAYFPEENKMGFLYPALGLAGEAGEVLENIKRIIRDDEGKVSPERRDKIKKELGDVLWYLSQLSSEFGLNLNDIAQDNLTKLFDRLKREKIKGEGDER